MQAFKAWNGTIPLKLHKRQLLDAISNNPKPKPVDLVRIAPDARQATVSAAWRVVPTQPGL